MRTVHGAVPTKTVESKYAKQLDRLASEGRKEKKKFRNNPRKHVNGIWKVCVFFTGHFSMLDGKGVQIG